MYSMYNTQAFLNARIDEEEGTISLELAGREKPFVINKDDELYHYHLKNIQKTRQQIIDANPLEEPEVVDPLAGIE